MNEKKGDDCFAVSIGDLGPKKLTLTLALQKAGSGHSLREIISAYCWFCGHEDKIVIKELEIGYDETEVQP